MKLSPAMEDALKGAVLLLLPNPTLPNRSFRMWRKTSMATINALERRGLCDWFWLTPAGIAERERLLK